MKVSNLFNSIDRFLSNDKVKQDKQYNSFMSILKRLKARELVLKKKLENEQNVNHLKLINMELAVIYVKRRKAVKAIDAIEQFKKPVKSAFIADTPHVA